MLSLGTTGACVACWQGGAAVVKGLTVFKQGSFLKRGSSSNPMALLAKSGSQMGNTRSFVFGCENSNSGVAAPDSDSQVCMPRSSSPRFHGDALQYCVDWIQTARHVLHYKRLLVAHIAQCPSCPQQSGYKVQMVSSKVQCREVVYKLHQQVKHHLQGSVWEVLPLASSQAGLLVHMGRQICWACFTARWLARRAAMQSRRRMLQECTCDPS